MPKPIESKPAAFRTISALRDFGYDFNVAVGDIVDNSLSPQLNTSEIIILYDKNFFEKQFFVRILDDGKGMNDAELLEAMRYGAGSGVYKKGDLSKFGMGLKTASLSQCNRLTVISRSETDGLINGYIWDVEHVKETNHWEVLKLNDSEISVILTGEDERYYPHYKKTLREILDKRKSWTLVMWDDLESIDRNFSAYKLEKFARNYFDKTVANLTLYLRMTFQRFLDGTADRGKVSISFNGELLEPWDPFCRNEPNTVHDKMKDEDSDFSMSADGLKINPVIINRYILPSKDGAYGFSSEQAWRDAKGLSSWNESQGYYIYRNDRLIDHGGWKKTKTLDEHDKLARLSIDLTEEHDQLFQVDVKKSTVFFPQELIIHIRERIHKGYIKRAKNRYGGNYSVKQTQNGLRSQKKKLISLSNELLKKNNIDVYENKSTDEIVVRNDYGRIKKDIAYRQLDQSMIIQSRPLGNSDVLWELQPHPSKGLIVVINEDHVFYDKIYRNSNMDKAVAAITDTFFFTMSFVELRCRTEDNEDLFLDIRKVASEVIEKFINENII
jgi:hypothetical protein